MSGHHQPSQKVMRKIRLMMRQRLVGIFEYGYHQSSDEEDEYAAYSIPAPDHQKQLEDRVRELENTIKSMRRSRQSLREEDLIEDEVTGPTIPYIAPAPATAPRTMSPISAALDIAPAVTSSSTPPSSGGVFRWDSVKPFPKNIPATRMWEAWTRFLEDFETAASLADVRNPQRRVELLLLSMGDELKSIVRAAKLRPTVQDDNYYSDLVGNIDRHLKAMTDPAAEHEDFSRMTQEPGESAVKFHARLTEKVILCNYSPADQERFVLTQLLRGLRNQEVKRVARIYNHDANKVVQAATRAEAFQAEAMVPQEESNALAVSNRSKFRGNENQRKRWTAGHQSARYPAKRFKPDKSSASQPTSSTSRRNRCSKCFNPRHDDDEECPAIKRECYTCGKRGHFSTACRAGKVRTVKEENSGIPKDEEQEQVKE